MNLPYAVPNPQPISGYCGIVTINGKNSFGAYAGAICYIYVIKNETSTELIKYHEHSDISAWLVNPPVETWR